MDPQNRAVMLAAEAESQVLVKLVNHLPASFDGLAGPGVARSQVPGGFRGEAFDVDGQGALLFQNGPSPSVRAVDMG